MYKLVLDICRAKTTPYKPGLFTDLLDRRQNVYIMSKWGLGYQNYSTKVLLK